MKKILPKISAFLLSVLLACACLVGCDQGENGGASALPKVSVPVVTIDKVGYATWEPVDGAGYYIYKIDGGAEKIIAGPPVSLTEGQSISVKAVSGREEYEDSDFSAPQTYRKGDVVEISFYAVNDLHGKFIDTDSQPGVDEFTTYVKDLYDDPVQDEVLLSSGDMWQGTVESSSNHGRLMTEWMNDVGFVSMTLGNHEYDWGPDALTTNSELAEFPLLGINVTYNGTMPDYCKASTVVERSGVKIGIIGAIGDCLSSISGEFQTGLSFATGSRLTTLVKNEATRLRTEENCDFIVYSLHDGGSQFSSSGIDSVTNSDMKWYDTSLSDGYVDLVFEGHSHYQYITQDEYGVYHLQGGGENRAVSRAQVEFNRATKQYTVTPSHVSSYTYGNNSIKDDPVVEELYQTYFPEDGPYGDPYEDVLGRNSYRRTEAAICAQVASLYLKVGQERWGADHTIVLAGGYLNTRSPGSLSAGEVTYADLYSLLPFDNDIILGKISGSYLKSQFFESRYGYVYQATVSASEISSIAEYYIVVDSYTAFYKRNNITVVERYDSGIYARDLLAEFIQGGGWA